MVAVLTVLSSPHHVPPRNSALHSLRRPVRRAGAPPARCCDPGAHPGTARIAGGSRCARCRRFGVRTGRRTRTPACQVWPDAPRGAWGLLDPPYHGRARVGRGGPPTGTSLAPAVGLEPTSERSRECGMLLSVLFRAYVAQ